MSQKENFHTKVLIIGAGSAGYTAAIYAARANLEPIVVQGRQPGGQLMITTDVENFPGFENVIQGPWLMEQMRKQAENVGAKMITDVITKVDFSNQPFTAIGESGNSYSADSVIIATGANARWLGLESEQKFKGFGVSACATCDGFFFRGQEVSVVGGGNTALEEALFMTNHASKVTLIHRRDAFRGEKVLHDRVLAHEKIEILWNKRVEEILGDINEKGIPQGMTGLRLVDTVSNEVSKLDVTGVFIAIGHDPATAVFKDQLDILDDGYIETQPGTALTSIPGIFAAGDVTDKIYRQAVTAAGMGCMAALEAEKFVASL